MWGIIPHCCSKKERRKSEKKGDRPLFLRLLRQKGKRIRDVNFED